MATPPPFGSKPVTFSSENSTDDQQPKPPQNTCSICSAPLGNDGGTNVLRGNLFCSEVCRKLHIVGDNSKILSDILASASSSAPDSLRCQVCNALIELEKHEFKGNLFCSKVCKNTQIVIEGIKQQILNDPLTPISLGQSVTDDKATSSKTVATAMASTSSSAPDTIHEACDLCNSPIVKIEKLEFRGHHYCSESCLKSHQLVDAIQEKYPWLPRPKLDDDEDGGASCSDETAG